MVSLVSKNFLLSEKPPRLSARLHFVLTKLKTSGRSQISGLTLQKYFALLADGDKGS